MDKQFKINRNEYRSQKVLEICKKNGTEVWTQWRVQEKALKQAMPQISINPRIH